MQLVAPWLRPAVSAVLAAAIALSPLDAEAASRSGGRVGGRAPSSVSRPSVSRSAPSSPAARPTTTNIYMAPAAPAMGMGYGYGGYGGYGYGGGGGNGLGLYLGLSVAEAFLREQQRQAYLQQQLKTAQQLGQDQAAIAALQQELAAQNAKVETLRSQQQSGGGSAPATSAPMDAEAMRQLQAQLAAQQREIEALKAK